MDSVTFFLIVPSVCALAQCILTYSPLPRRVKQAPAALALVVGLVCFLGIVGRLPLPETYYFDRNSFLAFPDYWHIGLFCIPVLVGLGIGAALGCLIPKECDKEEKP